MSDAALPRTIALEGASNVRDLGGYAAAEGRRMRFGLVFRGAALDAITAADRDRLAALGLRTVCDLRGTAERARAPSALAGVTTHALPIEPSVGAGLRDIAATRAATGEDAMAIMRRAYVAYATEWAQRYRALFALILQDGALPLLFHCSAGKDRTGFGAALLLTALGVSRADVMADYLATNRLWRGDPALAAGLSPETADVLLRVHAPLLDAAFEAVGADWPGYAERALGLDAAALERLRALLLA